MVKEIGFKIEKGSIATALFAYNHKTMNGNQPSTERFQPNKSNAHKAANNFLSWGAGPRASQFLILAAKTKALMNNRLTPSSKRWVVPKEYRSEL